MTIETLMFRLADGVDEAAFLDADRRVQTDVYYRHPGCLRRTTARAPDGEWLVTVLWGDGADTATAEELEALMDPASVRRGRYSTLD